MSERLFLDSLTILHNKGIRYGTVVDVGSADGQFSLIMQQAGPLMPLNVDANPIYEESLKAIQDVVGGHYRISALGDHVGSIELLQSAHPYWGSTVPPDDPYWSRVREARGEPIKVPMTTLDVLEEELGLRPPYLLKLDVQGAEAQVLRGAAKFLSNASAVICETDIRDFQAINEILTGRRFRLFDVTCLQYISPDGTLGWFYPVYVAEKLADTVFPEHFWSEKNTEAAIQGQIDRRKQILKLHSELLDRIRRTSNPRPA
jgi:FkbM family methyltransferase